MQTTTPPSPIIPFKATDSTIESVVPQGGIPAVLITEDPAADEREREAAFDAVFRWRGVPLLPFSSSRKSLWLQLRVAMGAPRLNACLADHHAFIPDAARILFLCSHEPDAPPRPPAKRGEPEHQAQREGWATLRSEPAALQEEIDRWQDAHIAGIQEEIAAVDVAMNLYAAAYVNRHEPAPAAATGADLVGN
jgi:hypothetical protein